MNDQTMNLPDLGWGPFYQSQLSVEEFEGSTPFRVLEVHRNAIEVIGIEGTKRLPINAGLAEHGVAVGDWVLTENDSISPQRVLDRKSVLQRRAAGHEPIQQLIAANIDTLFIVSSCNADFNPARIDRYLALAQQANVEPVVVLTKADLSEDPQAYVERSRTTLPNVLVEVVDATSPDVVKQLAPWCGNGQTIALLGSSGVGKSTIANALTDAGLLTQDIREDDAKGRHTTTARSMHRITTGGWLVDTPGMRELRLLDVGDGVDAVFEDVASLALECKFTNCGHESEPGCAIQAAIVAGDLEEGRLRRWQKLQREDTRNTETVAETHARARNTERKYREGKKRMKAKRGKFHND